MQLVSDRDAAIWSRCHAKMTMISVGVNDPTSYDLPILVVVITVI